MFVLNIDDDAEDRFIFMEAIKDINPDANCILISNGEEAIKFLSNDMGVLRDFIFLDINMPGMDGRECLIHLRAMKKLRDVPIVMFSTTILDYDKREFYKLNADCCQKTSDFLSLKNALSRIIFKMPSSKSVRDGFTRSV